MNPHTTLIIGKHGKTGRRVNAQLQRAGYQTRAVSRSTLPAFDWQSPEGWPEAMQGCQSAYVCFQPDLAIPPARQAISNFIRLAREAGIHHIVLLSGRGEDGAQQAEQLLINSGLNWNVVRASWFDQNFSEGFLIESIMNGQVALPGCDIPEPFVDAEDIAEVAFACLTKPQLNNQLFEVTGPELLTFSDCVGIISCAIQRPVNFVPITITQFLQALRHQGLADDELWLMNELFTVVMDGRNSHTTQGVEQALGRQPGSFRDYVLRTVASGAWAHAKETS
ncbi:NAD(P)H-binding protein [Amphritea atlantica]|uniref:NAD(P)H-binding protein n=1 Tax=Amphritea atlantica TaxID=355243 RepID=A0ABY5GYE0_9GAMM|nr:NAD(P)H-binding protein [Amphritea atlantica]